MPATVITHDIPTGLVGLTVDVYADPATGEPVLSALAEAETDTPTVYAVEVTGLTGLHMLQHRDAGGAVVFNSWATLAASGTIVSRPMREAASGGGGGNVTVDGVTPEGAAALRAALATMPASLRTQRIGRWPLRIIAGDDQVNGNGLAPTWEFPGDGLPDMTGWTAKLFATSQNETVVYPAEITAPTGSLRAGYVNLPRALTATQPKTENGLARLRFFTADHDEVELTGLAATYLEGPLIVA
jgi:hypothetical protein